MKSVCLVNGTLPPESRGGAENYVLRVASFLESEGYDVSILTTKPYDGRESLRIQRDSFQGHTVYRIYPLNFSHRSNGTGGSVFTKAIWHHVDSLNLHTYRRIKKFLKDLDPDVVHTHNLMGISSSVGRAVQKTDARHVHTLHDYGLLCPKANLMREWTLPGDEIGVCQERPTPCVMYSKAKEYTIGTPDHVIGPSQHIIDVHQEKGMFTSVPTSRIQHGVEDVADRVPSNTAGGAVLYAGRIHRSKGLETLFEAAKSLPDVAVHLCGSGPMEERATEVASKLENVTYHGFVSEDRLQRLRCEVDAVVVPSVWMENSPLVIYESFAMGVPVIGSDIGGIPELVQHGSQGYLFEPENDAELADCIRAVVDGDSTRMREAALAWARGRTMERHARELKGTYGF